MNRTLSMATRYLPLFSGLAFAVLAWAPVSRPTPVDQGTARPPRTQAGSLADYTLTFSSVEPRHIHVVARVPLQSDTLMMSPAAAELPDGYATFVHGLAVFDGTERVPIRSLSGGRWILKRRRSSAVTLIYDVFIAHDSVDWNVSGAFARGYAIGGTVFFSGRAVFIASAATRRSPIRIHVVVPATWSFIAPYAKLASEPSTYEAVNLNDLWANGCLAGVLASEHTSIGDLTISFAGGEPIRSGLTLFSRSLKPVLETYAKMMGGAPTGKLVVIANIASENEGHANRTGGEAFSRSLSLLVQTTPNESTRGQWEYLLAHELFHQWNPEAFPPAHQAKFEWLVEGFTDYMTRLALLRTGANTEAQFLGEMAKSYQKYLGVVGHVSLQDAGENKGGNYDLIYFGGTTLAAALDVELRRRTNGMRGVPHLIARMYADFRRTHHAYDYEDVVRTASAVAGSEMATFFARYVAGTATIPLETYLASAGLSVTRNKSTVVISRSPTISTSQADLLSALLAR